MTISSARKIGRTILILSSLKVAEGPLLGIPFLPAWSTFAARFLGLFLVFHFLRLGPRSDFSYSVGLLSTHDF